jgi:hypothetical protein
MSAPVSPALLLVDNKRSARTFVGAEEERKGVILMVKVSIEIRKGAARFSVGVRAQSIRRAVSLVAGRFPGADDVRVRFPIEPEGFLAGDTAARAGIAGFEQPEEIAA